MYSINKNRVGEVKKVTVINLSENRKRNMKNDRNENSKISNEKALQYVFYF